MFSKLGPRLALGCLLALAACGGDDDETQSAADAGARDAGGDSAAGGGKGTGSGKEGLECKSNADCESGLSCLFADMNDDELKVCARPCGEDNDCMEGERCLQKTEKPGNALCWNTESEARKPCGPAFTAQCDESKNLGCLRVENEDGSVAGGVCLQPCKLDQDDACTGGFSCLRVTEQMDEGMGLCVQTVGRDEVCDEPSGEFCELGNMCLSDGGDWRCYQDCSEKKECDDDKSCKPLEGDDQGSYCG